MEVTWKVNPTEMYAPVNETLSKHGCFFFRLSSTGSVPNVFSPQRREGAENSLLSFYISSASPRLCGEKEASVQNMLGTELRRVNLFLGHPAVPYTVKRWTR